MSAENYLIGMDCGTTNIKAVLLGDDGTVLMQASRRNTSISLEDSMQEQDAEVWWKNAVDIFHEISEKAGDEIMRRVRGIGISSHTVSLLPLDAAGKPLRNAITYQDRRSWKELEEILLVIGTKKFEAIVGGKPATAFLPSKILWYKCREPELFLRTEHFVQASSYINFKLCGVLVSDLDQAARTQCMDIDTMDWSKEIADVIGVDLKQYMPPIRGVEEIIGTVSKESAAQTGLKEGTPVIAGCSDAMSSLYATGLCQLGEAGESSGTSSLVFTGSSQKSPSGIPIVTKPCPIEGVPWVFDAPVTTTGAAIKWFIDTMGDRECREAEEKRISIYDYLNERALESSAGANGLLFFPYLLGERAPLWNDYARGMWIGLGMNSERQDLIRSVLEGTAYTLRHVIDTAREYGGEASLLRICGGGAKSRTWSRIKASVLNMPVYVMDETAGDVPVGSALMAGHAVGVFPKLKDAAGRILKVKEVIQPEPEWVEIYEKRYPLWRQMYQQLESSLQELHVQMQEEKQNK